MSRLNLLEFCLCWTVATLLLIASGSHCFEATLYNRYKGSIYLVFDFCEHDLAGLLSNSNVKFTLAEIKKVMQMLLNGLYYIHRNKVQLVTVTLHPHMVPIHKPVACVRSCHYILTCINWRLSNRFFTET